MEFVLDNDKVEDDFKKLLKLVTLRMNGVTSSSMQDKGMNYEKNYGVAYPVLKELAAKFQPNNLLALKLWHHKWRETFILATLLADSKNIPDTFLNEMVYTAPTEEVMNHIAGNTILSHPEFELKIEKWIKSENTICFSIACKALTKWAILHSFVPDVMKKSFSDWEAKDHVFDNATAIRSLADMIRVYGRLDAKVRTNILTWAKHQENLSQNKAWLPKLYELETEFEYL